MMTPRSQTTKAFAAQLLAATLAVALFGALSQVALAASVPVSSPAIDQLDITGWTRGRMTFYGRDGYSIHDGACHYGGIPHPYYVAALSDWWPEYINSAYEHNKCGHCFEVQCDPNGRSYCRQDRLNTSIIVRVTDRCPCHHENPSNKRWCCGDMPHFDVSHEAFGELASHTGGWVYLQWREIQCPDAVGLGGEILHDPWSWTPHCNREGDNTLADLAQREGLTTFLEAVWRAGPAVWDTLTTRAHTSSIIAPTNEAWEQAAAEMGLTVEELLDEPSLGEIVKYHFLGDNVDFENSLCDDRQPGGNTCEQEKAWEKCASPDFQRDGYCRQTCGACPSLETLSGNTMTLSTDNATGLTVIDRGMGPQNAHILRVEEGCNGNMAVVDRLLFSLCKGPDAKGVLQVAQEAGLLRFTEAVWKANLLTDDSLKVGDEYGLYTLLAPTDGAFDKVVKDLKFENFTEFLDSPNLAAIMSNHVIKGKQHMGYFEKECHDLAMPSEIIDLIPTSSSWDNSTIGCAELETLGFCSNSWIATGYCRETCGRCKSRGSKQKEALLSIADAPLSLLQSKVNAEDQLRVYNVDDSQVPEDALKVSVIREHPEDKKKRSQSVVIVPDIEACNGLINIVDSVLR
mmetsp:Transcript_32304/g.69604  ORF Transcript_32304/g.69604 Transcript_32304/m.69604 type:complete len:628 (+) Transcript_32304:230-2113(+)